MGLARRCVSVAVGLDLVGVSDGPVLKVLGRDELADEYHVFRVRRTEGLGASCDGLDAWYWSERGDRRRQMFLETHPLLSNRYVWSFAGLLVQESGHGCGTVRVVIGNVPAVGGMLAVGTRK